MNKNIDGESDGSFRECSCISCDVKGLEDMTGVKYGEVNEE